MLDQILWQAFKRTFFLYLCKSQDQNVKFENRQGEFLKFQKILGKMWKTLEKICRNIRKTWKNVKRTSDGNFLIISEKICKNLGIVQSQTRGRSFFVTDSRWLPTVFVLLMYGLDPVYSISPRDRIRQWNHLAGILIRSYVNFIVRPGPGGGLGKQNRAHTLTVKIPLAINGNSSHI